MDNRSPEQRSKNMRAVRSSGSKIEKTLGSALWARGLRYRKNDKTVFGRPDFTFRSLRIAVFVDSEFWHGKDWEFQKEQLKSNREFWHTKIEGNIKRDEIVTATLIENGWKVLRFWGRDVENKIEACVAIVEATAERATNKVKSNR